MIKLPNRKCKGVSLTIPPKSSHTIKYSVFHKILNIFNNVKLNINELPLKKQLDLLNKLVCASPEKDWI